MVDVLGHDSAIIGLKNPALISMPLAFVSGILVSLLRPEPEAAARFGGGGTADPPRRHRTRAAGARPAGARALNRIRGARAGGRPDLGQPAW